MRRRRINYGLITLLVVFVGLIVWLTVEGLARQKDQKEIAQKLEAYVPVYLQHALLPEKLRDEDYGEVLANDTFAEHEGVKKALQEAEADLKPFYVSNPVGWEVAKEKLLAGWRAYAEQLHFVDQAERSSQYSARELKKLKLEVNEPFDLNFESLIGDEAKLWMYGTVKVLEDNVHWTSFEVQLYQENGQWLLNMVQTLLVQELSMGDKYVY